jgi:hypothetical protein
VSGKKSDGPSWFSVILFLAVVLTFGYFIYFGR